ncbi:Fibrinogen-like protein A,Ryncolin-4,Angiopoietin-related protein 7,Angiopoietin-related protein 1,Ficolin-3,Techylectin-5A,Ficolin-2,Ryncolin-1,Tenascin-R, Fibrinogen-like protein 1,Angiopoietin-1,Fibrinogen C domain-containing protein 1-A,Tenascin-N,Tenascin,Fibroleukin,Fibrinogen C domain-containing protein 1,Angiopoietin-related protein 6,Techylectin-5B,Angiopoietin-2,Microfibril-associated glycoprotein 4,Fibrinogen alpha chain,Ficolin-1-A,Ficolin-1,Fibrinogen C domain-containing protein 1-B,Angiopoiet|uniref:Fibrinogen C-terminal domain-containing protein n=1 Tax=Mytilus coruscus TaxID=42192 RepID=A0A6J8ABD2_MYTCO|nr:Fibrinogen-like protein A,Ryncolin-4,Angiopoietin-related protein 7,Angiopoietin-related protein 1,Ficolin-3,Techylectin-5A,Ficolin-2,Ryncolin-1,Tenascin-R, Fibrinogen-like protein 1,Angiopoietin-1,Fibrinogen C domain-containing protein 1-A,Tenascin-N,Tenascin,Fibroleukin,Fibrinogen C domain-containing protein 1,Angiopoietin-related protein 6,Techylectin-5B,Angiopoietin-2,Microfibril-associated glycoprotein 4,Fibrinogen alpha chain,Ficolin-1-A,Ficolin-1,Fibrinogen C domain-containing protein 1-B
MAEMDKELKNDIKWVIEGICGRNVTGKDCTEIKKARATSGVYQIFPAQTEGVMAFCDMDTDSGGWTIIQKRYDGSVNFQRSWADYENGFGNVNGEYWLGNKYIHRLTSSGTYELRIDLTDKNNKYYAKYKTFVVGNASSQYKLTIGGYSGNAGDGMQHHNGMKFSTVDRDNDRQKSNNMCVRHWGPWWHLNCCQSALNNSIRNKWYWKGVKEGYVRTTLMMIRKT